MFLSDLSLLNGIGKKMKPGDMVFDPADRILRGRAAFDDEGPVRALCEQQLSHALVESPFCKCGNARFTERGSEGLHAVAAVIELVEDPVCFCIEPVREIAFMSPR